MVLAGHAKLLAMRCNYVRSRRYDAPTVYWSASSAGPLIQQLVAQGGLVRICSKSWRCAWITWCTGSGSPIRVPRLASLFVMVILPLMVVKLIFLRLLLNQMM